MKYILSTFVALLFTFQLSGQDNFSVCDDYSKHIFEMLMTNNYTLANEFVDLIEYTAYIDRIEGLPEAKKEMLKNGALKSYEAVKIQFNKESNRILRIYKQSQASGAELVYSNCTFKVNKYFKEIGFMTIFYTVNIPGEELELDAIRFECIKTANGWRVLDGFFDEQL